MTEKARMTTTTAAAASPARAPCGRYPRSGPLCPATGSSPRPRLVRRVMDAEAPLVTIAAPAGYGKTTLLEEWERHDARPFVWVRVDERGNDEGRLVAAIDHALDEVVPGAPRRRPSPVALAPLAPSLAARPPFVLVLDDLHTLRSSTSQAVVRRLAESMPAECRLALASRTAPALPLGRLRANRALTEIRPRDLVMTTGEAAGLLALSGLDLAPGEVEALVSKTEGWPAGLYLAALALSDEPDVSAAVAEFGGDDGIVAEYLCDEVLSTLSSDLVSFLMRTSVLDRLSGPVCDAVIGRRGTASLLSTLARKELLLVPLDRKDESYRCHRLLARDASGGAATTQARPPGACPLPRRQLVRRQRRRRSSRAPCGHRRRRRARRRPDRSARAEYVSERRNAMLQRWLSSFTAEEVAAHASARAGRGRAVI